MTKRVMVRLPLYRRSGALSIQLNIRELSKQIRMVWKFLEQRKLSFRQFSSNRAGKCNRKTSCELLSSYSPIQTDYARLIRCLLYGKQEKFNSFNVTGLYWLTFCWRSPELKSAIVCSSSLLFFSPQNVTGLDAGLDGKI